MDRLARLHVFCRVAELGSFSQAARQLNLPATTVSAAVAELEKQLGVRLLQRTTRRVSLTGEGADCLVQAKRLLADADELESRFRRGPGGQSAPRGVVRLDLPERLARLTIIPELPAFLGAYPDVQLRLSATDRFVDPVGEAIDCVVRVGFVADSTMVARSAGQMVQINTGARSYLEHFGCPRTLADLKDHWAVVFFSSRTGRELPWEVAQNGSVQEIAMQSRLLVAGSDAYVAACVAGLGLIQSPALGLEAQLADGSLQEVLPEHRAPALPVNLLLPHGRQVPQRVRVLVDWLLPLLTERVAVQAPHPAATRTALALEG